MIIRLAEINDVDKIMEIIEEARLDLKTLTKCQWQFGYPNRDSFLKDISLNQLYVGCEEDVVMVAALVQGVEPTYNQIYNGKWLQNEEYLTIHRIAVSKKCCHRGYAEQRKLRYCSCNIHSCASCLDGKKISGSGKNGLRRKTS